jgi:hypothetical protein
MPCRTPDRESRVKPRRACSEVAAGAILQNVYLFAASAGLSTVIRAWIDRGGDWQRVRAPSRSARAAISNDRISKKLTEETVPMFKKILLWQAEHPVITWAAWGMVWAIVLLALFWPRTAH